MMTNNNSLDVQVVVKSVLQRVTDDVLGSWDRKFHTNEFRAFTAFLKIQSSQYRNLVENGDLFTLKCVRIHFLQPLAEGLHSCVKY